MFSSPPFIAMSRKLPNCFFNELSSESNEFSFESVNYFDRWSIYDCKFWLWTFWESECYFNPPTNSWNNNIPPGFHLARFSVSGSVTNFKSPKPSPAPSLSRWKSADPNAPSGSPRLFCLFSWNCLTLSPWINRKLAVQTLLQFLLFLLKHEYSTSPNLWFEMFLVMFKEGKNICFR